MNHLPSSTSRDHRIRLAIYTSLVSKFASAIIQVVAVPVALTALGPERFGIFVMMSALLAWIDLGTLGIGPGLTRSMTIAWSKGDMQSVHTHYSTALFLLLAIALLIQAITLALLFLPATGGADQLISLIIGQDSAVDGAEVIGALATMTALLSIYVVCTVGDRARSAFQQNYVTNSFVFAGQSLTLALMLYISNYHPDLIGYTAALYGGMAISKILNTSTLSLPPARLRLSVKLVSVPILARLFHDAVPFWVIQLASLVMHSFSLALVGSITGSESVAEFSIIFRFTLLAASGVMMYSQPFWPAVIQALIVGQHEWIISRYKRLLVITIAYSVAIGLLLAILGEQLLHFWAGGTITFDQTLINVLGVYFVIWMFNHMNTVVFFGMGWLRSIATLLALESFLVILIGTPLTYAFGSIGMAIGLCVAGLLINAWLLPYMIFTRGFRNFPTATIKN